MGTLPTSLPAMGRQLVLDNRAGDIKRKKVLSKIKNAIELAIPQKFSEAYGSDHIPGTSSFEIRVPVTNDPQPPRNNP
jgi:hypothetical protein